MTQLSVYLVVVVAVFVVGTQQQIQYYNGFRVFRVIPSTIQHIQTLTDLEKQFKLDVWSYPRKLGDNYDVMVKPKEIPEFTEQLTNHGIAFDVLVNDVEKILKHERQLMGARQKRAISSLSAYTTNFINVQEIEEFLVKVTHDSSRGVNVNLINIGQSSEGRNLTIAKINKPSRRRKPGIFIDAGIHAREWIAPATAINFIYQLAVNPGNDDEVSSLLDRFDWYVMPVVNPDGYQYSIYNERMWRKTRNYNHGSVYRGVDANRNFNYSWDPDVGGSRDPSDDTYAGTGPFCIPESWALGRFLVQHGHQIKLYVTLHSYGQYLLCPWGYGAHAYATDTNDLNHLAQVADHAMPERYSIGTSGVLLYPAAGGSDDYAKGAAGIKYSYTLELPPRDSSDTRRGFVIHPRYIPTIASHTWTGIKAMAQELFRKLILRTP